MVLERLGSSSGIAHCNSNSSAEVGTACWALTLGRVDCPDYISRRYSYSHRIVRGGAADVDADEK